MNNISQINNQSITNNKPSKVGFKSNIYAPRTENDYDTFIKEQKQAQKNAKRKQNIMTGLQAGALVAIIASVGLMLPNIGSAVSLKKAINNCKNETLKNLALSELQKGPQMRSEKKIKEILALANQTSKEHGEVDLEKAIKIMDQKIVDMSEVKDAVLDFLIDWNYNIKNGIKPKKPLILNLDGAAGTGKTTITEVIAEAIGIPYKKVSMGGATGSSIIRGTESKFVGSEAGAIAKGQIENKTNRVLYLLDEVDKLGKSEEHGSAEHALLSLFDDQGKFTDDFLGAELDLSNSIFITTTNEFDRLSAPLKNRIRNIHIAPYGLDTKTKIAKLHLLEELKNNKMTDKINITDDAYEAIASLTNDAGGRETTRNIQQLIRKIKSQFILNETKNNKLTINKDFVFKNLVFEEDQSTKNRVLNWLNTHK